MADSIIPATSDCVVQIFSRISGLEKTIARRAGIGADVGTLLDQHARLHSALAEQPSPTFRGCLIKARVAVHFLGIEEGQATVRPLSAEHWLLALVSDLERLVSGTKG